MDIYDLYKPLRNKVQHLNQIDALADIWHYFQLKENNVPVFNIDKGLGEQQPFAWELSILAREILISASSKGTMRLVPTNELARVGNILKSVSNSISERSLQSDSNLDEVLMHVHRIGHQQFHWQQDRAEIDLFRYLLIYSDPNLNGLVKTAMGMDIYDLIFTTFDCLSHLRKGPILNAKILNPPGDSHSNEAYFRRFSLPIEDLVARARESQRYDETWEFSWNPLEASPLILLPQKDSQLYFCPIPRMLVRRVSQGLYYDLYKLPGFDNAYGAAFENYIGRNLLRAFKFPLFTLHPQRPFTVGKQRHDGIDWLLEGPDANLFIECKCKRLTLPAKILPDIAAIKKDLEVMASAIVQTYKNMELAEKGVSHWSPNGRPCYPVIITLEDWALFTGPVVKVLTEIIAEKLEAEGLSQNLYQERPYTIISSRHFDAHCQNIAEIGINKVFAKKTESRFREWELDGFLRSEFAPYRPLSLNKLFKEDMDNAMSILKSRHVVM